MAHTPEHSDPPWLSLGTLTRWLWERTFTKAGAVVLVLYCLAVALYLERTTGKQYAVLLSPVAIIPLVFVLFILAAVAVVGDFLAEWVLGKLFASPSPRNVIHQLLYFVFSCAGFIIAAILFGLGDPDVEGYWKH